GRYVDQSVVDKFLEDPSRLALGGVKQEVAVLMSDLRGFTRRAAALGPAATVRLLNRYFTAMFDVILAHDGMINEVRGDGILAIFGAAGGTSTDRWRALAGALDMQRSLAAFNDALGADEPALDMGIAVHVGAVIAGNIGSEKRVKYGIVGDAVNLTARIEGL